MQRAQDIVAADSWSSGQIIASQHHEKRDRTR